MEHAAGADHLIYGWFFFAFVIVCLLGIGELIRESVASKNQKFKNVEINNEKTTTIIATLLLVVGVLWNVLIGQPKTINDRPDLAVIDHPEEYVMQNFTLEANDARARQRNSIWINKH